MPTNAFGVPQIRQQFRTRAMNTPFLNSQAKISTDAKQRRGAENPCIIGDIPVRTADTAMAELNYFAVHTYSIIPKR